VNTLPISLIGPEEVSNASVYLASDAGRYVTGVTMPVDASAMVH
jgi:NAD(P)-dependent dehydrogenase (short-subunit alcohol dehydrogenase family)